MLKIIPKGILDMLINLQLLEGVAIATSASEEKLGKGHRRVNIMQIPCTHVCK
jgi:hypothetical protein